MERGEITFTGLKTPKAVFLRGAEIRVSRFRLQIEKWMRQIESVLCVTGNGESYVAAGAENTSGLL